MNLVYKKTLVGMNQTSYAYCTKKNKTKKNEVTMPFNYWGKQVLQHTNQKFSNFSYRHFFGQSQFHLKYIAWGFYFGRPFYQQVKGDFDADRRATYLPRCEALAMERDATSHLKQKLILWRCRDQKDRTSQIPPPVLFPPVTMTKNPWIPNPRIRSKDNCPTGFWTQMAVRPIKDLRSVPKVLQKTNPLTRRQKS